MEVKKALFDMGSNKAPGPDGVCTGFYQRCWSKIGRSLVKWVQEIFRRKELPPGVNSVLISLIPKVKSPEVVEHLRSISLCNVNYKVVTKVIVNRLRPLLNELVGPEQASFIPERQSCDNVIIIQELLHIMRKMKGKNGAMIIKIDLEKAYDRVMWDFLHQTLEWASIPHELIKLIMNCVQVEATAILWNGEKSESFVPSKGLRQGGPFSPYLFVLCMECLSHLIL